MIETEPRHIVAASLDPEGALRSLSRETWRSYLREAGEWEPEQRVAGEWWRHRTGARIPLVEEPSNRIWKWVLAWVAEAQGEPPPLVLARLLARSDR